MSVSDEITAMLPKRSTRRNIVYATLIFCAAIIGYIVIWGAEENSLHQSALAWSFSLSGFVIASYVFGAVADNWNVFRFNPISMK